MKRRRILGKISLAFFAGFLLATLGFFIFPQPVLTVESGEVKADVIVVLGGGSLERPKQAAELFRHGDAPRVLVSGLGDAAPYGRFLETNGVPNTAITLEGQSHTTRENAKFSIPILRAMGAKRIIIVTTWYHSRRALHCFEHYAPDLQFFSRPSYFAFPRSEWHTKGVRGFISAEYVKLTGYWVCYGVCPF